VQLTVRKIFLGGDPLALDIGHANRQAIVVIAMQLVVHDVLETLSIRVHAPPGGPFFRVAVKHTMDAVVPRFFVLGL